MLLITYYLYMITVGSVIVGVIGVALGVGIVWKSYPLKNLVGQNAWAERFFGPGGTITMYRAIGVIVIAVSAMYATGLFQVILRATLGGVFGAFAE